MKRIYLDYASATPVRKEAVKAMLPYFTEKFGNPTSPHPFGAEAREAVEKARAVIARTINAKPEEIIFTSGCTESSNLAIRGAAYSKVETGKHLVTSIIEHESVYETFKYLETRGFQVTYLPVDVEGLISVADIRSKITPKTTLVSIQHANAEIGSIEPIEGIARIANEKGVLFHTDAAYSYGRLPIDVKAMKIDLMSLDAHHIYGPKGVGALFVREGVDIVTLLQGRPDEHGRRAGMPNVPGIVGFSVAAELAVKELKKESKRESKLRDMFLKYLNENVKFSKTNGSSKRRLPNNINMSFDGIIGQDLVKGLEKNGIVTTTSLNDRVLGAIGVKGAKLLGSVRLTMGYDTKERDMRMVMKLVQKIVETARKRY